MVPIAHGYVHELSNVFLLSDLFCMILVLDVVGVSDGGVVVRFVHALGCMQGTNSLQDVFPDGVIRVEWGPVSDTPDNIPQDGEIQASR